MLNKCKSSIRKDYATATTYLSSKKLNSDIALKNLMDATCVNKFLRRYSSTQTQRGYRSALNRFFKTINANPQTYFETKRDYRDDIEVFADSLRDRPPKTFYSYIGVIRKFYQRNDVELKQYVWDDMRTFVKGKRALTQDRPPTIPEFKRILAHADLRQKTLFLTLASSGMRIGEATKIKLKDMDLEHDPTLIRLRSEYTKTGEPRICFISNETDIYMKEWLKHRQEYLNYTAKILNLPNTNKSNTDNRIFPFVPNSARLGLIRLLNLTKLNMQDDRTGRYIIHIHAFRKFFSSRMALSCPRDAIEVLMGHVGYLSGAYLRFSETQLAEMYKKSMHEVTISEGKDFSNELKQLGEEVTRRDKKIEEIGQRTDFLKNLDKKDLAKMISILKDNKEVWDELDKRPKKWIKNKEDK